ncbi:hypothetical protein [Methanobrevibacter oralis]|nr:hypothetical protein [Methanobrevibacter oralis]
MVKNSKKIEGHLELDEIKEVMKEYKDSYRQLLSRFKSNRRCMESN